MFFYVAKIFWTFAQPLNFIGLLLAASVIAAAFSRPRLSLVSGASALLLLAVLGWTTAGALLLRPLEDRFARPAELPATIAGIVVLGGAFEGGINPVRGLYEMNDAADRMTEAAILARRFPEAKLLISGGSGVILRERAGDGATGPLLFEKLGVSADRLLLDAMSRNTAENASMSRELAQPVPGETWLLVTSAFHMPRSAALFRRAGFEIVPWPADYRTAGDEGLEGCRENSLKCLGQASTAMREWIGLLAYWLTGRIDSPFPKPE